MPIDDEDDLFNEEFDLVDDDDFEDEAEEKVVENDVEEAQKAEAEPAEPEKEPPKTKGGKRGVGRGRRRGGGAAAEPTEPVEAGSGGEVSSEQANGAEVAAETENREGLDEYGRPLPEPNYLVHVYENKKLKRTIDRPFTPEDAEAFASEYNRTGKVYSRFALAGKNDAKPKKTLD